MAQAMDIFEWSIDALFKCCGWVTPEKYFTFELDIIFGTIIKLISLSYSLYFLDVSDEKAFMLYFSIQALQFIFTLIEGHYFIFKGKSYTVLREYHLKILCILQSLFSILIYGLKDDDDQTSPAFWIIISILSVLGTFDILELIYMCICKRQIDDYECVGFSAYFVKARFLGGIIGIIVMLNFYRSFQIETTGKPFVYSIFIILSNSSEIILLSFCLYQLCKERKIEKLIVEDDSKKKQKIKKWYSIIIGFNFGLVEVITAFISISVCLISLLCYFCSKYIGCCSCTWEKAQSFIQMFTLTTYQIIDYEILDQKLQQEDQLNPSIEPTPINGEQIKSSVCRVPQNQDIQIIQDDINRKLEEAEQIEQN